MRAISLVLALVVLPVSASAQEPIPESIDAKTAAPDDENDHEGWKFRMRAGALLSYNDVRDVVGTVEGTTLQFGVLLDAGAHLRDGKHDWESTLNFNYTQARTPALDVFIKSADELRLKSTYVYRFKDWLGPFVQVGGATAVARGFDVRSEDFVLRRTFRDTDREPVTRSVEAEERIKLTGPFEPFTLNESLGGFAAAVESEKITAKFKAGFGGEHVIVRNGFFLDDDGSTDEIEYTQLQSSNNLGGLLEAAINGTLAENVTYTVGSKVFYAAVSDFDVTETDPDTEETSTRDPEGDELFSVEVDAKLSVKVVEWATLDYIFTLRRIPWVALDTNQITNGLVLNIGYDLI